MPTAFSPCPLEWGKFFLRGNMASNNKGGALLAGMVIGGLVGSVTGLLLAPRSGKQTRQLLKKSADALPDLAEDLATTLQLQADYLSEATQRNWQGTLERLKEAIAAGVEATQTTVVSESEPKPRDITAETTLADN
ncbi:YtxH domain-containing protein [Synechocystis sp. FACHB-383]|uniref:YtxH domain-containing protein n=2 Tax=Synechocystis TaxID=1142 RepID=A0ABR9VM86_9SYNC|nr:YtxH domain-containing protein [Synechocystis sp. FACHB-383]MBE9194936.1 YtxH domain-containing protein [Synechocystis sp. LEGE 06083]MBE9239728.1 YtxH domain-containing protein [Synechocystis salina LEGE 00041]MBE9252463.1 YtxH domain-containing protein [Synechocystis salina LEGE 00031]